MSINIVALVEGRAKCPNYNKCHGILVNIKAGPIVAICPECGYHIKTKKRGGIPVTPEWNLDMTQFTHAKTSERRTEK